MPSLLAFSAHSYEKRECQMPPTDMVIIFKLVCFEIMTSFVCLIPFNNNSLSVSFTLTGYCTCVCVHACTSAHMCECLHAVLRAESERQRPLMFSPRHFQRNFIVNGPQQCTCPKAIQAFGISLPLCAGSCMPLVVCLVCACFGYVKRRAIFFNHQGLAGFTLGFVGLFNLFFIFLQR